ncbi:MAG: hypothetical protein K8T25_03830 [Planctomycetia bacterium]|nr:hypothetical protein [Planctomycetia bacterium]
MIAATLARPVAIAPAKTSAFYAAFVISLVLVSVPVKNFAYIVPVVYLLYQLLRGNRRLVMRVLAALSAVALVSGICLISAGDDMQVNVPGMVLALLTYLPIFIVACHPPVLSLSDQDIRRMQTTCAWFVIVQSLIGFVQFAISRNPDTVCGTFGLLDFRAGAITIAQVYYTFTLFCMLLFLFLDAKRRLVQVAIAIGLISCVLAQSGHQTIFFMASLGAVALTRLKRPKIVFGSLTAIVAIALLVQCFYPETFGLAREWERKVFDQDSPKRLAVEGGLSVLENPKNLLLGTGLGQFSSRAALMTSNDYLTFELPPMLVGKSTYYSQYIEPAMNRFNDYGEGSAIYKPYCSLLSVIVETGVLGTLFLTTLFGLHLYRNARLIRSADAWVSLSGMLVCVGMLFFALCCTIENYAEFAQALFLPALLYVAVTSRAKTRVQERATAAGAATFRSLRSLQLLGPNALAPNGDRSLSADIARTSRGTTPQDHPN